MRRKNQPHPISSTIGEAIRRLAATLAAAINGLVKNTAPVGRWLSSKIVLPDATISLIGGRLCLIKMRELHAVDAAGHLNVGEH